MKIRWAHHRKDPKAEQLSPELLAAYVDGEVTPSAASAVERILAASAVERRRADSLRHVREVLSAPVGEIERIDLAGMVRRAARREGLGHPVAPSTPEPRRPRRERWAFLAFGTAALTLATVVLVLRAGERRPVAPAPDAPRANDQGFAVRSAGPGGPDTPARWAGIRVYREGSTADEAPPVLADELPAGAGLLFSYTNVGPRPFTHLMILARDARGEVRWFFPAYERSGTNPESIAIDAGVVRATLHELVRQPFAPGPLAIVAVFSRQPLTVADVEHWMTTWSPGEAPPWPQAHVQVVSTTVVPRRSR